MAHSLPSVFFFTAGLVEGANSFVVRFGLEGAALVHVSALVLSVAGIGIPWARAMI